MHLMNVAFCCNPFISRGNNGYRHADAVHLIYEVCMREGNQLDAVLRNNVSLGSVSCPYCTDIVGIRVPARNTPRLPFVRGQLKCEGARAETSFRLSAKRTSPFKSAGGRQFSRLLAAEVCASAVVMLDTPCSEVV